jgi:raffinose/stachyose/melibiose transport system permease protein
MKTKNRSLFNTSFTKLLPFFAVPILLNVFIVVFPLFYGFYYSLHSTQGFQLSYVGFDNYFRLFDDKIFWHSLRNNFTIIISTILFQIGPAVIIGMMIMTSKLVMGSKFIRSIYFFPSVVSPIVIATIWRTMYSNQFGLINEMLLMLGLEKQNWLGDPNLVMTSIIIPLSWQYIGYYVILLLAGATSIDPEILEMAEIDGATGFKKTIYIIMPLLRSTFMIILTICLSGGIRIFDQIFALTRGGPGFASSVLAQFAYNASFSRLEFGYGATISIAMLIISVVIVMLTRSLVRRGRYEE